MTLDEMKAFYAAEEAERLIADESRGLDNRSRRIIAARWSDENRSRQTAERMERRNRAAARNLKATDESDVAYVLTLTPTDA